MDILATIIKAAKLGGEILKDGFYKSKNINFKGSVDLVTQYDVAVEKCVIEFLLQNLSNIKIIGEEGGAIGNGELTVYIDPIDGTTNFVHGVPHTAVSIGVWHNNKPIAGVVYNPILDELFYATSGCGAFLNDTQIFVSKTNNLTSALVATGFPYTKTQRGSDFDFVIKNLEQFLPITRDIRRLGSASLDLCYTAKGIFDFYYEINLKPWDYAAGAIVLLEAGGRITNMQGNAIDFSEHIVVASNSHLHSKILELLQN